MTYLVSALLLALFALTWRRETTADFLMMSVIAAAAVWNAGLAVAYFGVVP
jgi:hypothetical protein